MRNYSPGTRVRVKHYLPWDRTGTVLYEVIPDQFYGVALDGEEYHPERGMACHAFWGHQMEAVSPKEVEA